MLAKSSSFAFKLLIVTTLFVVAAAQEPPHRGYPTPPPPAVPPEEPTRAPKTYKHLDTLTMERDAREMSILAASVPNDVEQMKKGLLPKDLEDKLRRIEKLSKQLRGQIHP